MKTARIQAAVFDMNGTLVDDISFHFQAWKELCDRLGAAFDEARFQSWNGLKNEDIFPQVLGRAVAREELAALSNEKEERYRALYRPHLAPVRGAEALMARLREKGLALALASSAPPETRAMVLEGLRWTQRFDAVVLAEGLRGKPEPDIFLSAAERLGVAASACIVFEDARNGVRAALSAGMLVVGVTTNVKAEELLEEGARFAIPDFASLPRELDTLIFG
jgi:beta-phosphoglucomutase family hydrolase